MSILDEYVNNINLADCSAKLIEHTTLQMHEAKIDSEQLARLAGIPPDRMETLIRTRGEKIFREEVNVLCLTTGTGLDVLFDLPDLSDREVVRKEFDAAVATGLAVEAIAFCGPLDNAACDVDTMRSLLYLSCLRRCLLLYPSRENS